MGHAPFTLLYLTPLFSSIHSIKAQTIADELGKPFSVRRCRAWFEHYAGNNTKLIVVSCIVSYLVSYAYSSHLLSCFQCLLQCNFRTLLGEVIIKGEMNISGLIKVQAVI